jgi:hypothetical protein
MTLTPVGGHGYLSGGSANPSHVRNFFTQCESVQLPTDIFSPLWEFEFFPWCWSKSATPPHAARTPLRNGTHARAFAGLQQHLKQSLYSCGDYSRSKPVSTHPTCLLPCDDTRALHSLGSSLATFPLLLRDDDGGLCLRHRRLLCRCAGHPRAAG